MNRHLAKSLRSMADRTIASRKVIAAARVLLQFVRREITAGMRRSALFVAENPAKMHDQLRLFLDVFAPRPMALRRRVKAAERARLLRRRGPR